MRRTRLAYQESRLNRTSAFRDSFFSGAFGKNRSNGAVGKALHALAIN